ncbi:mechanosensitive ion channel protein 6-like [Rhododendron vialii]|uniref:mechanosensitive ion channel protein 6-like n=1 Tax=Rhododendron vialii TaxID=182163 RepID=UPI00265F4E4B|nr:mechanosensitive ion channel protein 6-like [Rhododendron vialii]
MMENWRIRNNSRFHLPPGIFFRNADEDGEERYCEDAPTYRCFSSPALAKLLFAMILLSILFTTTVPSFQTWELGHLRLWRWQLVAFFAFYGRFISRAITNGVLHVIENSNDARLKGNLPHAYAVKRTFEYLLSFATLLTAWILLIEDIPLKKLGNITKILSCVVVSMFIWGFKIVVWKVVSISFHRRNYLEQIKEAVFSLYILRTMLTPLKDPNQMTEEREVIVAAAPNNRRGHKLLQGRITFCEWRLVSTDTTNDWGVWNMVNLVRNAKALDETLRLLPHRRSTRPNLNTWDDKAMSVSEEIIKVVSKSESREISLEELSYCMPEAIAEEALKRIGATQGKFGIDELFIWMSRTFQQHKGLELSLNDTQRILQDLHSAIGVVVLAIFSFAWLVILDTVYLLPKDEESGLICMSYIFILFLALVVAYVFHVVWEKDGDGVRFFFRHQIQVGETCTIDGDTMQVEELSIYYTVFLNTVGHKMFCPNFKLLAGEGNFR